jgi:hypothetical protein
VNFCRPMLTFAFQCFHSPVLETETEETVSTRAVAILEPMLESLTWTVAGFTLLCDQRCGKKPSLRVCVWAVVMSMLYVVEVGFAADAVINLDEVLPDSMTQQLRSTHLLATSAPVTTHSESAAVHESGFTEMSLGVACCQLAFTMALALLLFFSRTCQMPVFCTGGIENKRHLQELQQRQLSKEVSWDVLDNFLFVTPKYRWLLEENTCNSIHSSNSSNASLLSDPFLSSGIKTMEKGSDNGQGRKPDHQHKKGQQEGPVAVVIDGIGAEKFSSPKERRERKLFEQSASPHSQPFGLKELPTLTEVDDESSSSLSGNSDYCFSAPAGNGYMGAAHLDSLHSAPVAPEKQVFTGERQGTGENDVDYRLRRLEAMARKWDDKYNPAVSLPQIPPFIPASPPVAGRSSEPSFEHAAPEAAGETVAQWPRADGERSGSRDMPSSSPRGENSDIRRERGSSQRGSRDYPDYSSSKFTSPSPSGSPVDARRLSSREAKKKAKKAHYVANRGKGPTDNIAFESINQSNNTLDRFLISKQEEWDLHMGSGSDGDGYESDEYDDSQSMMSMTSASHIDIDNAYRAAEPPAIAEYLPDATHDQDPALVGRANRLQSTEEKASWYDGLVIERENVKLRRGHDGLSSIFSASNNVHSPSMQGTTMNVAAGQIPKDLSKWSVRIMPLDGESDHVSRGLSRSRLDVAYSVEIYAAETSEGQWDLCKDFSRFSKLQEELCAVWPGELSEIR